MQSGVDLVSQTGTSLSEIGRFVNDALEQVSGIAQGASDQAKSIEEITTSIDQIDKMTSHNAGLVAQTREDTGTMIDGAKRLAAASCSFRLS